MLAKWCNCPNKFYFISMAPKLSSIMRYKPKNVINKTVKTRIIIIKKYRKKLVRQNKKIKANREMHRNFDFCINL